MSDSNPISHPSGGWKRVAPSTPSEEPAPVRATAVPSNDAVRTYDETKQRLHSRLIEKVDVTSLSMVPEADRRTELGAIIHRMIDLDPSGASVDRTRMTEDLLDEILGFGPLERLLRDPSVSDILVNGAHEVYVDRRGRLEETDVQFRNDAHVLQILDRIVSKIGRRVDESSPMVDARLPDGSRVNAVIPPLALRGPTISIRRFGAKPLVMDDLLRLRAMTKEMATFLEAAVKSRLNIVISGGTGSGKTTLLNTLSRYIPSTDRIITVEDAAELQLQQRHVVALETRPPNIEGKGAITTRDLVRNCLRMRPDRIVVGECRGAEAFDMLQAMNTGHDGSLTTLHANNPRDTLGRLETMLLMAGFELPIKAMRQQIAGAIQLLVQTNRLQGGVRRVTSVTEVIGLEGDTIITQDIFTYRQAGVGPTGKAYGRFFTSGIRPHWMSRLDAASISLPENFFAERPLLDDWL